jgi:hypothetical protein
MLTSLRRFPASWLQVVLTLTAKALQIHDETERTVVKALRFGCTICAAAPAASHPIALRSGVITRAASCLTSGNAQLQSAAWAFLYQLIDNQNSLQELRKNKELAAALPVARAQLHELPSEDKDAMLEEICQCDEISDAISGAVEK